MSTPNKPMFLAAPMLDYQCNLKGCCCQGWGIPFKPEDLARLAGRLPEGERARLGDGLELIVHPEDGTISHVHLRKEGPARRCLFLEDEGTCEVHRRFGEAPLPNLCVIFPVVAYDAGDRLELHFEGLCPSVLDRIEATDTEFLEVELDQAAYPGLATRARNMLPAPEISLGELHLDQPSLRRLRAKALEALRDTQRPAIEHLAALSYSFDRLRASGDLDSFQVSYEDPLEPFFDYLESCARAHDGRVLANIWSNYRRFVWDMDRDDPRLDPELLQLHLERWAEPLQTLMAPQELALRALLVRYLAHRYHSLFTRVQGGIIFSYGSAPHVYALGIRLAAGFSGALQAPTTPGIMKAALGMADYIYRSLRLPTESLPWFTPFSAPRQLWSIPLPQVSPEQAQMSPPGEPPASQ